MKEESASIHEAGGGVDVPGVEGDPEDDVFFCVAATSRGRKNKISFFHTNVRGEDADAARALAALCLDHAPEHHRWHHHTVAGTRTFAFLSAADGRSYFAAAEPSPGGAGAVRFLERVRDACDAAPRKRMRGEAVGPVARQFAQALRAVASGGETSTVDDVALPAPPGASPRALVPSTPLASYSGENEKDEEPLPLGEEQLRAAQAEESAQARRRSWWRHAAVVIVVDVVVCLVLFAVWMGVCRGFRCLTR